MSGDGEERRRVLQDNVVRSYSVPEVVDRYRQRAAADLRRWEEALLASVMPEPGTVLVVGCGSGREAFALEDRGWTVTAVDVTPALLEVALGEARARDSEVRFELVDGVDLPLQDDAVDAVTLWSQVLNNVPTRAGRAVLMREAHRVLTPGGVVSFSVHDRIRTMARVAPEMIVSVDDPEPGDLVLLEREGGVERLNHYFDKAEITTMCTEAGFSSLQIWHTSDLGEAWNNVFVAAARKAG
jgi:SAM-dependent methyltransferase